MSSSTTQNKAKKATKAKDSSSEPTRLPGRGDLDIFKKGKETEVGQAEFSKHVEDVLGAKEIKETKEPRFNQIWKKALNGYKDVGSPDEDLSQAEMLARTARITEEDASAVSMDGESDDGEDLVVTDEETDDELEDGIILDGEDVEDEKGKGEDGEVEGEEGVEMDDD